VSSIGLKTNKRRKALDGTRKYARRLVGSVSRFVVPESKCNERNEKRTSHELKEEKKPELCCYSRRLRAHFIYMSLVATSPTGHCWRASKGGVESEKNEACQTCDNPRVLMPDIRERL